MVYDYKCLSENILPSKGEGNKKRQKLVMAVTSRPTPGNAETNRETTAALSNRFK
jgi:hypothetical protein